MGENAKQIKRELMIEGGMYAFITFALVATLGSMIVYTLFYEMRKQFEYMDFTLPVVPLFVMAGFIFLVCILVPRTVYGQISKVSIVDRLKKSE